MIDVAAGRLDDVRNCVRSAPALDVGRDVTEPPPGARILRHRWRPSTIGGHDGSSSGVTEAARVSGRRRSNTCRASRDRVLNAAEPLEGATLLDVGAGDGLIGWPRSNESDPRAR